MVIFGVSKPNLYSIAKILGSIETNKNLMSNYKISTIRISPYKSQFYTKVSKIKNVDESPFIIFPISIFTAQFQEFQNIFHLDSFKKLKGINPNIIIIAGGWHTIGAPESVLKYGADYAIVGESEESFPILLNRIFHTYESRYDFIQNLEMINKFLRQDIIHKTINHIGVKYNNNYYIHDIHWDTKDKSNFVDLNNYPPYSEKFRVFCPIEISRGCPYRCKFCQTGNYWKQMRHAKVDTIVKWIKKAAEIRYDRIWFTSPDSFAYGSKFGTKTNPEKVELLLKQINKIKKIKEVFFGTFPSEVRPEHVTRNMMDAVFPYINNKYFTVGAQTASNRLLKYINRGHTFEDVLNATDLILEYGYGVDLDFIFGLPGETSQDLEKTIDFFNDILKSTKKIRIHTHTFMPLPGTPFANEEPGVLIPEIEEIIGQLATHNKAYGSHQKQERLGKKISKNIRIIK